MSVPVNFKYPLFLRNINKDCNNIVGYPIITVEDDFNIEAKPNTFYDIKNNIDDTININFNINELYAAGKDGLIFFTCENFHTDEGDPNVLEVMRFSNAFGIKLIEDNSLQRFKYKSIIYKEQANQLGFETNEDIIIYYSDYLQNGKDITVFIEDAEPVILKNIYIINKDPYIIYISTSDLQLPIDVKLPVCIFEDITNSDIDLGIDIPDGYNYAYTAIAYRAEAVIFTKKPYQEDNNCITIGAITNGSPVNINYEVVENINVESSDIMKEFIFNINSPTNISFNNIIKWNNSNVPDLTQQGICTISIVNGVACYTFVNT